MISSAYAQSAAEATNAGGLMSMIPLLLMFAIAWFLMIRPQMKRAKEHKALIEALAKGDEVVTQGGLLGRISTVGEQHVHIEIADNTTIIVQRHAIQMVLPKGTLKTL